MFSVIILISFLLFTLLLAVYASIKSASRNELKLVRLKTTCGEFVPVRLISSKTMCQRNSVVAIPIELDENGIPLVEVFFGGSGSNSTSTSQSVKVALDTASCDLVISGSDCNTCGNGNGKYDPKASPSSKEFDECITVTYGTQSDRGCWWSDDIKLVGKCITSCSELHSDNRLDAVEFPGVQFVVSKQRMESPYAENLPKSDYSVMGLCHSNDSPPPFLKQVLGDKLVFSIFVTDSRKWFIVGAIPQPCTRVYELESLNHPEFYVVALKDTYVGRSKIHSSPSKLIFDTGSNMLFVPHNMLEEMRRTGILGVKDIRLGFANFDLTIPVSTYMSDDTLLIYGYESNDNSIILGSLLLYDTITEYNATERKVKIGSF